MCGIIGYTGERDAAPLLLDGLQRLEYRGYDSAGVAVMDTTNGSDIHVVKGAGKLTGLRSALEGAYPPGACGIGHTRWATHGKPTDGNAHPHRDCTGDIVVIHNGIVENYLDLRSELASRGHDLSSETDTEVLPHLIEEYLNETGELLGAFRRALARLEGAHAIVAMSKREPGTILAARAGNAGGVVVGYGEGETFVSSDLPALLPETQRVAFLQDGEIAVTSPEGARYVAFDGTDVAKAPQVVPFDPVSAAKGTYKHFMLKEIMEQPECLMDTFRGRAVFDPPGVVLEDVRIPEETLARVSRVVLIGMGTSMHAAMVGRTYFERIARVTAEVDNSSEFRYRQAPLGPETLVVSVAQSGETVDTLEAMAEAKRQGAPQVTICNTPGAQSTRVADGHVLTRCGPEVAVASTKTLTASITALYLLACRVGRARGTVDDAQLAELIAGLAQTPSLVGRVLQLKPEIERIAHALFESNDFLFLARGAEYPMAMEGALKLKEVSYIHAEGYPAGEMKHGPIALIDRAMPVVAIAVKDGMRDKMLSNIEQVRARDGIVVGIITEGDDEIAAKCDHALELPPTSPLLYPILTAVPMQLLSYHIALRRGCDVDQPRNLAKTVTVE
jgi:glutamine---fructose-6-phosphate transaminase (isomerizing)